MHKATVHFNTNYERTILYDYYDWMAHDQVMRFSRRGYLSVIVPLFNVLWVELSDE